MPDGALHPKVLAFRNSSNPTVTVSIVTHNDLFALLLLDNAIKRYCTGICAPEYTLCIEYLLYSRQDHPDCSDNEAWSLKVVGDLISCLSYKKCYILDPHSEIALAVIRNSRSTSSANHVANAFDALKIDFCASKTSLMDNFSLHIVSPDRGALKRCKLANDRIRNFQAVDLPVLFFDKERDPITGKLELKGVPKRSEVKAGYLIVDDICDGGGTFVMTAKVLNTYLRKRKVPRALFVTHGIFSKGLAPFKGVFTHIFTTGSYLQPSRQASLVVAGKKLGIKFKVV